MKTAKKISPTRKKMPYTFVVDVGNTHTVLGIYKGDKIEDHWRLTTRKETTSDEVLNRVGGLIRFSKIKPEEISYVGLSTVVPVLERPWVKALQKLLKKPVQVVNSNNCLDCPIAYLNPASLGADRLCNIISLRDRGYSDAIVIDMGTATTFDVIEWSDRIVANNTDDAIRAGLLYGFIAELEALVKKIKQELGKKDVPVFATGGWGRMVLGHSDVIDTYDPYLTVNGVRLVAMYGNKAVEIDRDGDEE